LAAALLSPTTAEAAVPGPVVIDFTGDTPGAVPNGYSSPDAADVLFFDTNGADLFVLDGGAQSHGQSIRARPDDASAVEIRLAHPSNSIKMGFGNDDPAAADVTDQAQLTVFRGATQVGQVLVNVNANDVMDQTIAFDGKLFNRAQFQYVDAAQVPLDLIEIVDDIKLGALCTIVGTSGNNNLNGTAGKDVICADAGVDVIKGNGGADLIYAGSGNDRVNAGRGGDKVFGGPGRDNLSGRGGQDILNGGLHRDTCDGGTQKDKAISCEVKSHFP
jgi:Ca2+-binding RTX toxin-like protein